MPPNSVRELLRIGQDGTMGTYMVVKLENETASSLHTYKLLFRYGQYMIAAADLVFRYCIRTAVVVVVASFHK